MKMDHILPEPHQHLRGSLPADASVHIRLARKKHSRRFRTPPEVSDGISEEDYSLLVRRGRW
jgi:hypothetical protein